MSSSDYGGPPTYEPIDALSQELHGTVGDLSLERPTSERVRPVLLQAAQVISRHRREIRDPAQRAVADATLTLLVASAAALQATGTCRVQEPFADVYEVIDPDGSGGYVRRLCCTHDQQHCVTG
jgi:hypothetical protein